MDITLLTDLLIFVRDLQSRIERLETQTTKPVQPLTGKVSVTQFARANGVPRNTVLLWIKSGKIPASRIGHKWYIEA